MQPLSGLVELMERIPHGSDAKRRSVATSGLKDAIPVGLGGGESGLRTEIGFCAPPIH